MSTPFAAALAAGDMASLARDCLAQLPRTEKDATLGILYVSEPAAPVLPQLVRDLAAGTGINSWVGGVGLGICAGGEEIYDRPAAAVMIAPLPSDSFRLFAATDDPEVDQHVFDLAEARGVWVHCPDDPSRCSAHAMALVRRGPVQVAVTTSGTSPALAAYLRGYLDARLDPALGDVAALLGRLRRELLDAGATTEGRTWSDVVDDELVAAVAAGDLERAESRVRAAVLPVGAEP